MSFTDKQIDELDAYFKKIKLPTTVQLDAGTTITDVSTFINSHLAVLRNNLDKQIYEVFLQRLEKLKELLK